MPIDQSGATKKATVAAIAAQDKTTANIWTGVQTFSPEILVPSLTWSQFPIIQNATDGVFVWQTQAYTNFPSGYGPYANILAIGDHTLNPTTHNSNECFVSAPDPNLNFCGDEVAFGSFTLSNDINGRDNTAIVDHALFRNVSGRGNTAVGSSAAANIHTSSFVDAFGLAACQDAFDYAGPMTCIGQATMQFAGTTSQYATAIGFQAGLYVTDAEYSTMVGMESASTATTIKHSTVIGQGACAAVTSIISTICIGGNGPSSGTMTNVLWVGGSTYGSTPILYGNLSTNQLAINASSVATGAALTIAGGDLEMDVNTGIRWNNDAGFNRDSPSAINCGTGALNDYSCTLTLTKLQITPNTNLSSPSRGLVDVGAGTSSGTSGSFALTNLYASGFVRPGQTSYAGLSTADPSPQVGDMLDITDASACTANVAVTAGGGSAHSCATVYNGSGWVAIVTH